MVTKIEWVINPDGSKGKTWNPISGCSKASDGCRSCYAEAMARRFRKDWKPWTVENAAHNVRLHPERLDQPLHWRKPRKVFVCSMSDLFHDQVTDLFIARVFSVMVRAPKHTFQILTKRPERMLNLLSSSQFNDSVGGQIARCLSPRIVEHWYHDPHLFTWPLPNVWLGVTAENQRTADKRIPILIQTPAKVRFVSIEPMLGPINIGPYIGARTFRCKCERYGGYHETEAKLIYLGHDLYQCVDCAKAAEIGPAINQIIAGGESGPRARPMHPDWVRSIRDQCLLTRVPFFFKQWGEWAPNDLTGRPRRVKMVTLPPEAGRLHGMFKVGKKAAGRELDGRTWEKMPG